MSIRETPLAGWYGGPSAGYVHSND